MHGVVQFVGLVGRFVHGLLVDRLVSDRCVALRERLVGSRLVCLLRERSLWSAGGLFGERRWWVVG